MTNRSRTGINQIHSLGHYPFMLWSPCYARENRRENVRGFAVKLSCDVIAGAGFEPCRFITRFIAEVTPFLTASSSPSGIRTLTEAGLSRVPLPIGVRGHIRQFI